MPLGGGSEETASTRVALEPSERSAALRSRRGAHRDLAEVGLRHDEHVGDLHDPRLQELQHVAAAGLHDDGDRVGDVGDLGLGLADADRLDHDDVERRRERVRRARASPGRGRRGARRPRSSGSARRGRRVELDPRAVAEQRAARAARARIDREHRHRALRSPRQACSSAESSVDLPAPGGPVTPIDVPGRLAAERGGGDLAQQRRRLLAVGRRVLSSRFSAAGAALRSRSRRRAPSAAPSRSRRAVALAAPSAEPRRGASLTTSRGRGAVRARARRSATMSRMMRVMSKSFGV